MASKEGKGSIILKLLILILIVALVLVIIIPGRIWKQEQREMNNAHMNMMSIYESEKYYKNKFGKFTSDPSALLNGVREDSVILQRQKRVNYTTEIKGLLNDYLDIAYISAIMRVHSNIDQICTDIRSNERNFKMNEDIANEAQEICRILSEFNNASEYYNYIVSATYLDSLNTIRNYITDYTLQTAASKSKQFTDTLQTFLPIIQLEQINERWKPMATRLQNLARTIRRSEISKVTSVDARIDDFRNRVNEALRRLTVSIDREKDLRKATEITGQLEVLYERFLNDFIITSKPALVKLSEPDSLILHLTEDNFYSPVNGEMYKILIDEDSTAIKVESPILLEELQNRTRITTKKIEALPMLSLLKAYSDSLDQIVTKSLKTRAALRKNTDIFILYKEVEEIRNQFKDISIYEATRNLDTLVWIADNSKSYSSLKDAIEDGLNGIRIYNQAYEEKIFGNLDSLHTDMVNKLNEFNETLAEIRWLPDEVENFEGEIAELNTKITEIKNASNPQVMQQMKTIEQELGDLFFFASEGTTKKVYGVFEKTIQNFGYIYKDTKSWEEE